jgi:hypothetical protein
MRANLNLNDPRWKSASRRAAVQQALNQAATELSDDIKLFISSSRPAGRTYRVGAIKRKASRRNNIAGLITRGNKRIVGATIRRASAPGQPPAIDTGRLINSIQSGRIGEFKYRVFSSVYYALILDSPNGLNRPFFRVRVENFRPRFRELIRIAWTTGKVKL